MSAPSVSVVIPAYRNADHLGATMRSVLSQTYRDFELIVVDDCSDDGSLAVAQSFGDDRIRVMANERRLGVAGNWNRAVAAASGRYLKLLCGDDVIYRGCLERQVEAMSDPTVVLVASRRDIIDERGRVVVRGRGLRGLQGVVDGPAAIRHAVRSGTNPLGEPAAVLIRRETLARAGPFAATRPYVIDLDMWLRALAYGRLFALQTPLCAFRLGSRSLSRALRYEQSRQVRELLHEVRASRASTVTALDAEIGVARACVNTIARRGAYWLWARRRQPSPARPAGAARPIETVPLRDSAGDML